MSVCATYVPETSTVAQQVGLGCVRGVCGVRGVWARRPMHIVVLALAENSFEYLYDCVKFDLNNQTHVAKRVGYILSVLPIRVHLHNTNHSVLSTIHIHRVSRNVAAHICI